MAERTNKLNSALESFTKDAISADAPYQRVNKNIEQVDVIAKRPAKKNSSTRPDSSYQPINKSIEEISVIGKRPEKTPAPSIKGIEIPEEKPIPLKQNKVADKSNLLLDIRNGGSNKESSTKELRKQLEAENWAPEEIDNAIKHSDRLYDFMQNKKYHLDLFGLENKLQGLTPSDKI